MMNAIVKTNGLVIADNNPFARVPSRPLRFRQPDFDAKFDKKTLVYSAFRSSTIDKIFLIGPDLLNLQSDFLKSRISLHSSSKTVSWRIQKFDRIFRASIDHASWTDGISINGKIGDFQLAIEDDQCSKFANERVIFTKSKNNNLVWIKDWIRFHRDVHGATAVLIYDNGSTAYSLQEMSNELGTIKGINSVVIVDWPFTFGPTGIGRKKYWDSDFSQYGILEDARWRFLQHASSAIYLDIDELVLPLGDHTFFEAIESSAAGMLSIDGWWMNGFDEYVARPSSMFLQRHKDYQYVTKARDGLFASTPADVKKCMPKWGAVPAQTPLKAQWHTHRIKGWSVLRRTTKSFEFRHFQEINLSWKYDRLNRRSILPRYDVFDDSFAKSVGKVNWDE